MTTAGGTEQVYGSFNDAWSAAIESEGSTLKLLSDVELIEASFVERPQPGLIFVYSDRVELSGRMQMRLPAKASPEAISNATQSLRQTIERYLETLQPQEGIDLEA